MHLFTEWLIAVEHLIGNCIVAGFQPDVFIHIIFTRLHDRLSETGCFDKWSMQMIDAHKWSILVFREQHGHLDWKKPHCPNSKMTKGRVLDVLQHVRFQSIVWDIFTGCFRIKCNVSYSDRRWLSAPFRLVTSFSIADGSRPELWGHVARLYGICDDSCCLSSS